MTYELYGKQIKTIGITGTNGKTTVASFIGQLLMQQQKICLCYWYTRRFYKWSKIGTSI